MATKNLNTRIVNKHDIEANWLKATTFTPYKGEIIIYDIEVDEDGNTLDLPEGRDTPYTYERLKIGDGKNLVKDLPFYASGDSTDAEKMQTLWDWYSDSVYTNMKVVLTISPNTTTYELGSAKDITFSWTFDKTPVENVKFNDESQDAKQSDSKTVNVSGTKTYQVSGRYAEGKKETATASKTISFYNRYYWGYAEIPDEINSNFVKNLQTSGERGWATSSSWKLNANCPSGKYIWYAYPKRFGTVTFKTLTGEGGFEPPEEVSVTNDSRYEETYYVYKSTDSGISGIEITAS